MAELDLSFIPEAPVFFPTEDEFANAYKYFESIRPIAEKFGIAKIVPPSPTGKTSFTEKLSKSFPDPSSFKFLTKLQNIHQLKKRVGPNEEFIEKLKDFQKSKGLHPFSNLPRVDGKELDLFKLYTLVDSLGGYRKVMENKSWNTVARELKISSNYTNFTSVLPKHYISFLLPFEEAKKKENKRRLLTHSDPGFLNNREESKQCSQEFQTTDFQGNQKRSRHNDEKENIDLSVPKKQHHEPMSNGRRIKKASARENQLHLILEDPSNASGIRLTRRSRLQLTDPDLEFILCSICRKGDRELFLLLCDQCNKSYHTFCLKPKLKSVPNGKWFCYKCRNLYEEKVDKEEEFGYGEGQYFMMDQFNAFADSFKRKWFNLDQLPLRTTDFTSSECESPPKKRKSNSKKQQSSCKSSYCTENPENDVEYNYFEDENCKRKNRSFQTASPLSLSQLSLSSRESSPFSSPSSLSLSSYLAKKYEPTEEEIEREFWRIVESSDEYLQVHYGSDLSVQQHGSGFPMNAKDPNQWNLNNLAVLDRSLLKYLPGASDNGGIPGVTQAMMYVGMVFSTFCWHNEDNYLYSINYLHKGAPKSWYGVPASDTSAFEELMQRELPSLFAKNPDILYQLVTMVSPTTVLKHNVKICHTIQRAGEFIITFPKAYHAGFSHGFNCAESVNFAPADWLPHGRESVKRYRVTGRSSVFSHEELVFYAASDPNSNIQDAAWIKSELSVILTEEREIRAKFHNVKVVPMNEVEKNKETSQCAVCKYDCYLSSIFCQCFPTTVLCLNDYDKMCQTCPPSKRFIVERHSLKTLSKLLENLESRLNPRKKGHTR